MSLGHAQDHPATFRKSQFLGPMFESFYKSKKNTSNVEHDLHLEPNCSQNGFQMDPKWLPKSTPNPTFMKTWKHKFGLLFATLEACPKSLILGIPSLKKTIKKQMYNKLSKIAFDLLTRDADGGSAAADRWQRGPLIRIQPKSKPVSTIVSSKDGYIYIYIYIYSISVIIFSQGQDQG